MTFDEAFARVERSPWLRTRFSAAVDPELPAELEPFSFVPLDGLRELAAALAVRPGETLVDLACGRGGPGLWLARDTGAELIGVDGSAVAVAQAAARAHLFGAQGRSRFTVGDLAGTGLPDGCADGVVCVDSFQFAGDRVASGREVLRLLRSGRRFVLTNWEPRQPGDAELPDRFRDLDIARTLSAAGFVDVEVHERPAWEPGHRAAYEAALAAGDPGDDEGLAMFQEEAQGGLDRSARLRRVLVVARRPDPMCARPTPDRSRCA